MVLIVQYVELYLTMISRKLMFAFEYRRTYLPLSLRVGATAVEKACAPVITYVFFRRKLYYSSSGHPPRKISRTLSSHGTLVVEIITRTPRNFSGKSLVDLKTWQ